MLNAALLKAIIENAIDGIMTIDDSGRVETINPSACILFRYAPEEIIGKNISIVILPDTGNPYGYQDHYMPDSLPYMPGTSREAKGLKKDGTVFPLRLSVSEVPLPAYRLYTCIIHDLTREKEAQEKLKEHTARLEQQVAERTQSLKKTVTDLEAAKEELSHSLKKEQELNRVKSRLVSMASHEFRAPLSAIQLSAALIEKYALQADQTNMHKHIRRIRNLVGNLTAILNDFLSLEKLESGNVEPVYESFDMVKFAKELTEEMQLTAKQNQLIVYQHTSELRDAYLDKALLKNSIINLIGNAIKYSPENTPIDFNTHISYESVTITIVDKGIGIPEPDQQYLFQAFFRAGNAGHIAGTGLGLNIVTRYVALMKGAIRFYSKENHGTSFTLTFPNGINTSSDDVHLNT